jgi:hypothetical protein
MQTKYKAMMSFTILLVMIFGLYFFTDWFSKVTGYLGGEDERTKLAQCLDNLDAEFYDGEYCVECEKQRKLFGTAMRFVDSVVCETEPGGEVVDIRCENLREIPAWYINGSIYYGYQNISELREISGCEEDKLEDFR